MKKQSPIVQKAEAYVFSLIRDKLPPNYIYHNYNHTVDVVESVIEIAEGSELSKEETEMVVLAAWFHDTGFIEVYDGHEEKSQEIAAKFLRENLYPEEKIEMVLGCIAATKYPQQPTNMLEYVICDADLSGIASKKYYEKAAFLRRELELALGRTETDAEWLESEVNFLSQHRYHTPYAHLKFDKKRTLHVLELKDRLNKLQEAESKQSKKQDVKTAEKAEKEKRPERGIETMFRVTISNHMNLSKMADDKANFLLSINGIILSFAIANIISKLDVPGNLFLVYPTAILVLVCLVSIIFAILSTRPKISEGRFTKADIQNKRANLLFFGNFYNMELEDFHWGFNEMMNDRDYLYGSMIKDLYFLGKVLGKKYRLVRVSYTIFMYGIIAAVIGYAASYMYFKPYLDHVVSQPPANTFGY
ncbi:MAG: phosphohydrolase [Chitinophagales bacterium]|nr:HD domain-containing protein [Bacteroidota bacterium]MBX7139710.1 phosphohydrolase [Chitinophagales bacterium]